MILRLARLLHTVSGARLWLLLALMVAGALAETIGLVSLVPLLFLALGEAEGGQIAEIISAIGITPTLQSILAIFLAAFAARILIGLARDRLSARIDADLEAAIGIDAARSLAAAPFDELAKRGRGDIQSLLGFDIPRTSAAAGVLIQLAGQLILLGVAGLVALTLSPLLTIIAMGAALLILLLAAPRWSGSHKAGDCISQLHAEQDAMAQRMFGALKAAKAQGSGDALAREYGVRLAAVANEQAGLDIRQSVTRAIVLGLSALTIAAMVLMGARGLDLGLATLATLLLLFARLVGPVQAIQRLADQLAGLLPAFARIEPLLEPPPLDASVVGQAFHRIEAKGLSLSHGDDPLFDDVSFTLQPGQWLALTGASGVGKTGLIDMIAGLQTPTKGQIIVDGSPLDARESWPASIAYVPQADLLFQDSIAANLSVTSAASPEEMHAALQLVGLERALDDAVSEIGGAMSGGERQRLLIARALCRKPHLLLLDEGLSALDEEAAIGMIQRLRAAYPRMGAMLITHHNRLADHCDHRIALGT